MSLLDNITLDDLDEDQRQLAECIGLESYKKLIKNYAGSYVYICKPETLIIELRNKEIRKEFNGYNFLELAHKYNLSERMIRNIVAEQFVRIKNAPLENQTSLFEEI